MPVSCATPSSFICALAARGTHCPRIWALIQGHCAELDGVNWEWQAADTAMGQARWGDAVGRNPTDRGQPGTQHRLRVEAGGEPRRRLGAGTHAQDTPSWKRLWLPWWCPGRDPAWTGPSLCAWTRATIIPLATRPWPATITCPISGASGEEPWEDTRPTCYPARRWVGARTLAWLSQCRGLRLRYEQKAGTWLALLPLAGTLIGYRRGWKLRLLRQFLTGTQIPCTESFGLCSPDRNQAGVTVATDVARKLLGFGALPASSDGKELY